MVSRDYFDRLLEEEQLIGIDIDCPASGFQITFDIYYKMIQILVQMLFDDSKQHIQGTYPTITWRSSVAFI